MERRINKEKHLSIIQWVFEVNNARKEQHSDWNQPIDWRMVTAHTLHKYIPFEKKNINIAQAVDYIKEQLAPHERRNVQKRDANVKRRPHWYGT